MKTLYKLKDGMEIYIKEHYTYKELADLIGIDRSYMSQIVNRKRLTISKTIAYAICKALRPDYEIKDIFNIIEEK